MLNAFMVWLQERSPATEEGQMRWRQVVDWVNSPPASPAPQASPGASPAARVSRPEVLPAGAPVTADAEAAAFAAFEGLAG